MLAIVFRYTQIHRCYLRCHQGKKWIFYIHQHVKHRPTLTLLCTGPLKSTLNIPKPMREWQLVTMWVPVYVNKYFFFAEALFAFFLLLPPPGPESAMA